MTETIFSGKRLASVVLMIAVIMVAFSAVMATETPKETYKRVIADGIGQKDIKTFSEKGCLLKHLLGKGASFDCPEAAVAQLNASLKIREVRIFHITDLNADTQIEANKVWSEGINGTGVKDRKSVV